MGWDFSSVFYKLLITDLLNNFFLKHRESGTWLASTGGMNLCAPGGAFEVRSNILWPVAFSWEWEQPSWKGNKTLWSFKSLLPANRRKSSWRFLTLSRQWIRARSSLRSWWGGDQSLGEVEIRSATLTRNVSTVSRHRCCNNIWNGCQRPVQVAVISIQMLPNTFSKKFKPQAVL